MGGVCGGEDTLPSLTELLFSLGFWGPGKSSHEILGYNWPLPEPRYPAESSLPFVRFQVAHLPV